MKSIHVAFEVSTDEHFKTPFLKSLKENWPSLAKDYRHFCHTNHPKQGDMWIWTSTEAQKFILFVMDDDQNNKLDSEQKMHFFRLALRKLSKEADLSELQRIDLPKGSFKFTEAEQKLAKELMLEAFSKKGPEISIEGVL